MRLVQIAAAVLIAVGSAAPTMANPVTSETTTTANSSAQTREATSTNSSDRRICVRADLSNTRISRRVCKTQAEWDREGGVPQTGN